MRVCEVDEFLDALDRFEFDAVLLVGLYKETCGDPELRKLSVEHDYFLLQGEVGSGCEGLVAAKVVEVLLGKLSSWF